MIAQLKKTLLVTSLLALATLPFLGPVGAVSAIDPSARDAACQAIGSASTGSNCNSQNAKSTVDGLVATVVNILSWIVGIASVIMIIIGGFKYVTSQGDSAGTSSAKNTILYAIIGLVITVLAQALVQFVLTRTT